MNTCLSDFALDDFELHASKAAPSPQAQHLSSCARCQQRRRARADAVTRFQATWADDVWKNIRRKHPTPKRRWRLGLIGIPALTLAVGTAAILLIALPRGPSYLAPKGSAALAQVFCRRDGRTFVLAPGDEVRAGDELRFRVLPAPPGARYVHIGSVDGTGRFTPFYPASDGAPGVPIPGDGEALPGSIRLDDAPGPEHVLVLLSEVPLAASDVRRAAESVAAAQAELRKIGDAAVAASWIVLPKRAASAP